MDEFIDALLLLLFKLAFNELLRLDVADGVVDLFILELDGAGPSFPIEV